MCSKPDEEGRWKDQREKKQFQTIKFVIDEVKRGGGAWCTRQRKGGVLVQFSRIKIRSLWYQQVFIIIFYFWSQPSHPGCICFLGCFIEKVCCFQESACGTFLYNSARGVEG